MAPITIRLLGAFAPSARADIMVGNASAAPAAAVRFKNCLRDILPFLFILFLSLGPAEKVRIEEDHRKQAKVVCIYHEVKLTTELSNYGFCCVCARFFHNTLIFPCPFYYCLLGYTIPLQ